ncbi:radical SAM protein [Candidatus Woesearchaeota archaeon]|nr:radical SAM protein [Candidatus Woesearchaeota archaeon]
MGTNHNNKRIAEIIVGNSCNANCYFCYSTKTEDKNNISTQKIRQKILEFKDYDEVVLNGGEPTIRKDFLELLKFAGKYNVKLTIKTNLFLFSIKRFVEETKEYIKSVEFSYSSFKNYDKITGIKNSKGLIDQAMENLIKTDIKIVAVILISNESYQDIEQICRHLYKKGVRSFQFWYISSMEVKVDLIKFTNLIPYLKKALEFLEQSAKIKILHLPLCTLDKYDKYYYNERTKNITLFNGYKNVHIDKESFADYVYTSKCDECVRKKDCIGLRQDYFKKYKDNEIVPFKELITTKQVSIINGEKIKALHILINGICNSNCEFCFSRKNLIKENYSYDKIKTIIDRESKNGFKSLVISGGEPTIHPNYIKIIKYAKKIGYNHVKTITNGRMFADYNYIKEAYDAKLDEVNISIHSHIPEVHDGLTKVKNSFRQGINAVKNCINLKISTKVCIVVNKKNICELPKTLLFFKKLGIDRIGLLRVMPFGKAWKNRTLLFENNKENFDYLTEALTVARQNNIKIELNRFDLMLFHKFPEFTQHPMKLLNEVYSKIEEYENLIKNRQLLYCYPQRCKFCFLEDFCLKLTSSALKKDIDLKGFTKDYIQELINLGHS